MEDSKTTVVEPAPKGYRSWSPQSKALFFAVVVVLSYYVSLGIDRYVLQKTPPAPERAVATARIGDVEIAVPAPAGAAAATAPGRHNAAVVVDLAFVREGSGGSASFLFTHYPERRDAAGADSLAALRAEAGEVAEEGTGYFMPAGEAGTGGRSAEMVFLVKDRLVRLVVASPSGSGTPSPADEAKTWRADILAANGRE